MGSITEVVTRLKPLNLLVDRSRDGSIPDTIRDLEPHGVFRTTENFRRLTRRMLTGYDLVVCCAQGSTPYSRAERAAVRAFVEEGGTVVLAASPGDFEAISGRPVRDLAVNGLAAEFGFAFETAAELSLDPIHRNRHHSRHDLELTAAGRRIGLLKTETFIWYPGTVRTPRNAVTLLRVKRSREAVFAKARFGRGTVAVYADIALFGNSWTGFPASLHLAHLAPTTRRGAARPAAVLDVSREELAGERVSVRYTPFTRHRAERIRDLAAAALVEVERRIRFPKPTKHLILRLEAGCWFRRLGGEDGEIEVAFGADRSEAQVADRIANLICQVLLSPWWGYQEARPFIVAAADALALRVRRRVGFGEAADSAEHLLRSGPAVDAATCYSHLVPLPTGMSRLFLELEDDLGDDLLKKLSRAMPKKKPFEGFPGAPFTTLDCLAFFLARACGEKAYDAIAARGHTLRRLPLGKPGTDEFKRAVNNEMRKILRRKGEKASSRLHAARHLKPLRLGNSPDPVLVAIDAILQMRKTGDPALADRLVKNLDGTDTAFQLAAGQALAAAGDPRAEDFSFGKLPGCTNRIWENGTTRRYAAADGVEVAVVLCGPTWWARGHGGATSTNYVFWVHTVPAHRRLGISRAGFGPALETRAAKFCASTQLHAMSDYFAHALYRDFGLIDSHLYIEFDKKTENVSSRAPRGIRIRPGRMEDAAPVAELSDRLHAPREHPPLDIADFPGRGVTRIAEENGKLIGAVWFTGGKLAAFAVDDGIEKADRREAIGIALLRSAERELHRRKVKSLRAFSWMRYDDAFHIRCLYRAGFAGKRDDLREQTRIRDLGQFLSEMERTLTARLPDRKGKAPMTIALSGGRLQAALTVGPKGVKVLPTLPKQADLRIEGDEMAITRMVLPLSSPFEEYNQTAIRIYPPLTGETRKRLEALFPKTCE